MSNKSQAISLLITVSAALIFLFFNSAVTIGLLLGYFCSKIHLQLLIHSIRKITQSSKPRFSIPANLLRIAVLALPLLVAVLFKDKISIIATVMGIMMSKICLFIDGFKKR